MNNLKQELTTSQENIILLEEKIQSFMDELSLSKERELQKDKETLSLQTKMECLLMNQAIGEEEQVIVTHQVGF
jgi:hypothetical protein